MSACYSYQSSEMLPTYVNQKFCFLAVILREKKFYAILAWGITQNVLDSAKVLFQINDLKINLLTPESISGAIKVLGISELSRIKFFSASSKTTCQVSRTGLNLIIILVRALRAAWLSEKITNFPARR